MSWLAKSLASSLRLSPSDQDPQSTTTTSEPEPESESDTINRTVKEDLSDLTQTLSRQFWGVASFLSPSDDSPEIAGSPRIDGIKSDFAEIGTQFKSGISLISNAKVVSEVSKMATSFLQFGSDDEEEEEEDGEDVVDEEVVGFVRELAMHPKTWVDFPDFDSNDLELSEAQAEHILAMEQLVPELADFKNELCSSSMTEGRFWTIYFLLLFPKLDKDDAEVLSSPQIMKAREMLLKGPCEQQSNQPEKSETKSFHTEVPSVREPTLEEKVILPIQTDEHLAHTSSAQIIDKTVTEEELAVDKSIDWFEEEIDEADQDTGKTDAGRVSQVEVDVSFSDLEEDDDDDYVIRKKEIVTNKGGNGNGTGIVSSPESNKSSDWLEVDDLVVD
ncbi:BSD domain containing protein [Rhynchospora pubera]|uniref:BSD domain containing protein n=1 Tax=Rhynchospora pubera TaxID=906938 RepID=A0AAV8EQR0_9POAL|nr:BSD domain containing protein [Rhynchospora pubera]